MNESSNDAINVENRLRCSILFKTNLNREFQLILTNL